MTTDSRTCSESIKPLSCKLTRAYILRFLHSRKNSATPLIKQGEPENPKDKPDTCKPIFNVKLMSCVLFVIWVGLVLKSFDLCNPASNIYLNLDSFTSYFAFSPQLFSSIQSFSKSKKSFSKSKNVTAALSWQFCSSSTARLKMSNLSFFLPDTLSQWLTYQASLALNTLLDTIYHNPFRDG